MLPHGITAINLNPKKTCFTIFHVEFMISISYMVIIFLNYKEQHDLSFEFSLCKYPTMRKTKKCITHSLTRVA